MSTWSRPAAVVCRNSVDLFLPNEAAGLPASSVDVEEIAADLLSRAIR